MTLWAMQLSSCQRTSHSKAFQYSEDKTRIYFDRLSENVCGTYPDMKLYLGCEVYCEAQMMKRVLKNLHCGRYPTMNGTEYVLMEFSPYVDAEGAIACVEPMVNAGYKPIIAHMERYPYLCDNMDLAKMYRCALYAYASNLKICRTNKLFAL